MKELQLENLMLIFDRFYFLITENYGIESVSMGLRAYPSVSFKNEQTGLKIEVCGSDIGCECEAYNVYIVKKDFFSRKFINVSKEMDKIQSLQSDTKSIQAYSDFIRLHLMPVVRGEQGISEFLKKN